MTVQRLSVASLLGAQLDYWVARAAGLRTPVVAIESCGAAECLVEVDGTAFATFSPTVDPGDCDAVLTGSAVMLMRIQSPIGPAWAALTPEGHRFISTSWRLAALRAYVARVFGVLVTDEATA
ncbi:hypothetical protein WT86_18585 [Burkholderia stagnalis]|nr:hypothetical protein WT86_18585 [Burkholderia stagnalis]KWN54406.1 hypothetical protein WT87_03615 [Burkholderia stagnalis]KWO68813.1 hypothetical protein WT99_20985 [Burkholderia stagnalis]